MRILPRLRDLLHNRVVAVTAGAVVVAAAGAGGAVAAETIGSRDVIDNSLRSIDVHDDNLRSIDLKDGSVHGVDLSDGSVGSAALGRGSVLQRHVAEDSVGLNELNDAAISALSETTQLPTVLTLGALGPFAESNTYCGDGTSTGSQGPVNGTSATPPLGAGSYRLAVGEDGDSLTSLALNDVSTDLADLHLRYSTFVDQPSASPDQQQAPFVILDIDTDGDGQRDDQIFFEPVYQNGQYAGNTNQGSVRVGEWQTWNATLGGSAWWHFGDQGVEYTSLSDYLAANPDAALTRLRVSAGCGAGAWTGFVGNVDSLEVNDDVFDFERF